jgi:hypothetical protein
MIEICPLASFDSPDGEFAFDATAFDRRRRMIVSKAAAEGTVILKQPRTTVIEQIIA